MGNVTATTRCALGKDCEKVCFTIVGPQLSFPQSPHYCDVLHHCGFGAEEFSSPWNFFLHLIDTQLRASIESLSIEEDYSQTGPVRWFACDVIFGCMVMEVGCCKSLNYWSSF